MALRGYMERSAENEARVKALLVALPEAELPPETVFLAQYVPYEKARAYLEGLHRSKGARS